MLQRLNFSTPLPLHGTAGSRQIEAAGLAAALQPPLMERAGLAVARLAQALAPHAPLFWVVCGPGNNGGDGLAAATALHQRGCQVLVHWLGTPSRLPPDTLRAWQQAQAAGLRFATGAPPPLTPQDLVIDALLGLGTQAGRALEDGHALPPLLQAVHRSPAPVLCVDLPSGLLGDSGQYAHTQLAPAQPPISPRHTLSLLTLHPGLFTAQGRDAAGQVWWDDLDLHPQMRSVATPCAWLAGAPARTLRLHASHKGSFGDVCVIGGEGLAERGMGMTGAALLAATAALHAGAGRVLLHLLDSQPSAALPSLPELMLRSWPALQASGQLAQGAVVCGCGGGQAVRAHLPAVLEQAQRLVLDADALNAIAADAALAAQLAARADQTEPAGWQTVLTPHPLEAARLLGTDTATVQADRLGAAQRLAAQARCTVLLKGSGSVIASPGQPTLLIPTGNARLATGGTGDVLAGLLGALLAAGLDGHTAATQAAWRHGACADTWPAERTLTAGALARALQA